MEQMITEPTMGEAILDLVLSKVQDMVTDVAPIGNKDHNTIHFSIYANRKLPPKTNKTTFDFRRDNVSQMKGLVKKKVKGKEKKGGSYSFGKLTDYLNLQ